jgi:uncharacterized membrane protein YfcA
MMAGFVSFADQHWTLLLECIACIGVAGALRGFTGFGFGLAATPLLSLLLPPPQVVPLVLLLQVGASFVGFKQSIIRHDVHSTRWLGLSALVTTPLGVWLLHSVGMTTARLCISLTTLAAVAALGSGWRHRRAHGAGFMLPFGFLAGILSGLCAMPSPPILAYYLGVDTPPSVARASMILIFLATGILSLITNFWVGGLGPNIICVAILATPIMIASIAGGSWLFERSPARHYRPIGLTAMTAIALSTAVRAVT